MLTLFVGLHVVWLTIHDIGLGSRPLPIPVAFHRLVLLGQPSSVPGTRVFATPFRRTWSTFRMSVLWILRNINRFFSYCLDVYLRMKNALFLYHQLFRLFAFFGDSIPHVV